MKKLLFALGVSAGHAAVRTRKTVRLAWKWAAPKTWSVARPSLIGLSVAGGVLLMIRSVAAVPWQPVPLSFVAACIAIALALAAASGFAYVLFKFLSEIVDRDLGMARWPSAVRERTAAAPVGQRAGPFAPPAEASGGSFSGDDEDRYYLQEQVDLLRASGILGDGVDLDSLMKDGSQNDFDFERLKRAAKGEPI